MQLRTLKTVKTKTFKNNRAMHIISGSMFSNLVSGAFHFGRSSSKERQPTNSSSVKNTSSTGVTVSSVTAEPGSVAVTAVNESDQRYVNLMTVGLAPSRSIAPGRSKNIAQTSTNMLRKSLTGAGGAVRKSILGLGD